MPARPSRRPQSWRRLAQADAVATEWNLEPTATLLGGRVIRCALAWSSHMQIDRPSTEKFFAMLGLTLSFLLLLAIIALAFV